MNKLKTLIIAGIVGIVIFTSGPVFSQADDAEVPAINEAYVMFKRMVWRKVDLEEKQNLPFFALNAELPRLIIDAVKAGRIFPYETDSLNKRMSKETFLELLKLPEQEEDPLAGSDEGFGDGFGDFPDASQTTTEDAAEIVNEFGPRDFSIVQVREEVFFDRNRSRMYYDIKSITLYLSSKSANNQLGFEKKLASFSYKQLKEYFRSNPEHCVWYNAENQAENKNLADAFDLRLFSSHIIKYANPQDNSIIDIYGPKNSIYASMQFEYDLMDYENELWEY